MLSLRMGRNYSNINFDGTLSIGTLPLVITSDVSPAGNYSVRIVASTGAKDTVSYIISDIADPTGKGMNVLYIAFAQVYETATYISLLHYKLVIDPVECFIPLLSYSSCSFIGSVSDQ